MDEVNSGSCELRSGRQCLAAVAILAALSLTPLGGCAQNPPPQIDRVSAITTHLDTPDAESWIDSEGPRAVKSLSASESERVAEHALAHPSAAVRAFGVGLMFEKVDELKGARAAATQLIRGDDLTGMLWAWIHAAPPNVADRRLELIRKEVQNRLPSLTGQERMRAQKLLCGQSKGC